MSQLPEDREVIDSAAEHVSDHNELHRLHNVIDGAVPAELSWLHLYNFATAQALGSGDTTAFIFDTDNDPPERGSKISWSSDTVTILEDGIFDISAKLCLRNDTEDNLEISLIEIKINEDEAGPGYSYDIFSQPFPANTPPTFYYMDIPSVALQAGDTIQLVADQSIPSTAPGIEMIEGVLTIAEVNTGIALSSPPAAWDADYVVTGSNATTTSTSLVDVTGLVHACTTNSVYEFEAVLYGLTSGDTNGVRYGVGYSAAGATVAYILDFPGAGNNATGSTVSHVDFDATAVTVLTTTSSFGITVIKGILETTSNAGNFSIQHHKVSSGTSTVKIGSNLKIRKVSP